MCQHVRVVQTVRLVQVCGALHCNEVDLRHAEHRDNLVVKHGVGHIRIPIILHADGHHLSATVRHIVAPAVTGTVVGVGIDGAEKLGMHGRSKPQVVSFIKTGTAATHQKLLRIIHHVILAQIEQAFIGTQLVTGCKVLRTTHGHHGIAVQRGIDDFPGCTVGIGIITEVAVHACLQRFHCPIVHARLTVKHEVVHRTAGTTVQRRKGVLEHGVIVLQQGFCLLNVLFQLADKLIEGVVCRHLVDAGCL